MMRLNFKQLINQTIILLIIVIFSAIIQTPIQASTLKQEIEVIEKLYKDGVLTKEEFEKTKKILIRNAEKKKKEKKTQPKLKVKKSDVRAKDLKVNVKTKPNSKEWEKAEIIFRDYRIYTYRPGGIKVTRISDGKDLLRITDNFKIKYLNNSQNVINVQSTEIKRPSMDQLVEHRVNQIKKETGKIFSVLKNPGGALNTAKERVKKFSKSKDIKDLRSKKDFSSLIPKDSIKLKLNIEGINVLNADGRYVNFHDVFFYQFIAANYEPFHYYIKLRTKPSIALNMNFSLRLFF